MDIAIPTLGDQNHISADRHELIRKGALTDQPQEGRMLRYVLLDRTNTDTACSPHSLPIE